MSNNKGKGPKLFFNQEFVRIPANTNMQDIFVSKQEMEEPVEMVEETEKNKRNPSPAKKGLDEGGDRVPIKIDNLGQLHNSSPTPQPSSQLSPFKRVKLFKEMDIQEQLEYLLNYPKVLPPATCIFYMDEQKFLGFLKDYADNQLTIQLPNQTTKTIQVEDLKKIIMLGIKK